LRGEALDALSRDTAVPVPQIEAWRTQGLASMEQALHTHAADDPAQLKLDEANRRIGRDRILRLMRVHRLLSPY